MVTRCACWEPQDQDMAAKSYPAGAQGLARVMPERAILFVCDIQDR